ncbi:MAG: fumarylacetoacetate hydrolase family protein [Clostridiales bacterium]|nr:fumarylacetoacetate hydrolase family protein [Clostridiales bacterium]
MLENGEVHLGAVISRYQAILLDQVFPELRGKGFVDFIRMADGDPVKAKQAIETCARSAIDIRYSRILPPMERPVHDILCVGVNYADHRQETKEHFAESSMDHARETVYFLKRAIRILGTDEAVEARFDLDDNIDYEVELAVIIGKGGKGIREEDAEQHIFGYSVFNDFSSRKLQTSHGQWMMGKSLDTYTAMGPLIADRTELPFPLHADIKSYVNGEMRQYSNTAFLIKSVPALIAELSAGITLESGDIIATGTPAGVGMGYVPPRYLKKGDSVTCEIEGIGRLTNVIY